LVYLRKIETRGFKSMGAKVISTPVERGFVAITGPNGSGKSNLLDAILFALGENSTKTLRVPSLSALIYDGSVEEQKPSSAKVSLQFDNSDRRIPIDSDSVTISRELKLSGESLYSLNGKHTQRNNLSDLLENALIASRGLNVVLQGMITRIAELVPDEKRKLIEQMVGIAQFDEKKNLALTQLKEADVKLEVAMAKIGEIRDRVQLLEQQRNDMLRVKQLEDQIRWLRAASSSTKLVAVRRTLDERKDAQSEYIQKAQNLQNRLTDVLHTIEDLESERSMLIKSAVDTGTAQIEAELGKVSNELNALKRERQEALDYVDRTKQVIPALAQIVSENRRKLSLKEEQIVSIAQKISHSETRRAEILEAQRELGLLRKNFESEFLVAQEQIGKVRKEKEMADMKLQTISNEHSRLISDRDASKEKLVGIQEKIGFYMEGSFEAQVKVREIEVLLEAQRAELGDIANSKSKIERLSKKVEQQLDIAASIIQKTQNAIMKYDSDLSAMESVAAEEIALKRLESLGGTNAINGYLGPLRSLISYDSEYSQAVAAIGREWLNAIVVENVQALIKATQAAKKLKISRLTTIPLSEVGEFNAIKLSHSSRHVGMIAPISQLIRCEKEYRRIVNFVFGDAVLVDSPSSAFVAARKGFRAVTLQGDIFEPEVFAFETGYSKRYAQITNLLNSQEGFESIRRILGSFRSFVEKRNKTISILEQKAKTFDYQEQKRNLDISKIEAKLESSRSFIQRYAELAQQMKDKVSEIEAEVDSFEQKINEKEAQVRDQSAICEQISRRLGTMDLSAFNQRLTDLGRKEYEIINQIESVTNEIRDLTTEQIRARAELENSLKPSLEHSLQQQVSLESNLESKSKLLEETQSKFSELQASFARLKEEEARSIEKSSQFQPLLEALDRRLKTLRSEEDTVRRAISSADRDLVTANLDINRMIESERQLLGELAMLGYPEPIEAFEGAENLSRELNNEYDLIKNNVNLIADRNYREIFENYKYSSIRKNDLEKERNAIVTFIETIDSEKRRVFMEAYERIDRELRVIFNKITDGAGWLEIENQDAIFDSGIFLMTQFPGKLPRDSSSVSGGEKTISALSFILAIQAVFPSPFYVFDEVDAHLDSRYSGRLADILAQRSDRSQIIIVSLKDNVVAKAGSVIGVYMSQGSTKVIRYRSPMEVPVINEQQQQ
jgi:chromosome segregation protein